MNHLNRSTNMDSIESREDRLYDTSLFAAFVAMALLGVFMYDQSLLTIATYASVLGPLLCLPWFFHNHKKNGKDKDSARSMLTAIGLYPVLAAVFFTLLIRVSVWISNLLFSFL